MKGRLLVLFLSVSVIFAEDSFEENTQRIAFKVLNDCSVKEDFSMCLKTKAVVFLERLGRMKQFSLTDGVCIVRSPDVPETESNITEEQLDKVLPRSADARSDALNNMLVEKLGSYLSSRTVELSLPKTVADEARREGGGGGGKMKDKKDYSRLIMLLFGAKASALGIAIIAATFLIAKKALIIGKIALIISAIIVLKKLLAAKHGPPVHYEHGHGGWDYDWHGGGWLRRHGNGQDLAYTAYTKQ